MEIMELLLLALAVSMDAFAVSVCKGMAAKKATLRAELTCGGWFGSFQALMTLAGFLLANLFAQAIQAIDHWVAFGLLAIIGINMLKEAFEKEECSCCSVDGCGEQNADLSVKTMFIMAVATSIDALAVGISLAMAGNVNIVMAVLLIGACTCGFCTAGVKIGNVFGSKFEDKAQMAGGFILILLGTKILTQYFFDKLGTNNPDYVVVSPDLGSVTRARKFTDKLDLPMAIVDKRRPKPNVSEVMNIIGDIKDKNVILVDDMVDTAGTLCNGAKALVERGGCKSVIACATHGVLSGPAIERLQNSVIDKLILLDTIPVEGDKAIDKIEVLTVADLFAEAIHRIYDENAISDLFN